MNCYQYLSVFILIVLNINLVLSFGGRQIRDICKINEVLNKCGNLCERTCDDIKGTRPCPAICGRPACVCSGNYVRHPNGQCVLPQNCPSQCPKNETYTTCGSSCPRTCNPRSDAQFACPAVCLEGCFCPPDYVTSKTYGCISPSDCPSSEKCFDNEVYNVCGTACPDSCDNYKNPNRICTLQCVEGCFCKPGLVLDAEGNCISPDQCPQPTCGEHEYYTDCGTACPDTCSNLGTLRNCIDLCVAGCFCEKGYVKSASGKCILPSQCPVNETCTKPNEHYNQCGTSKQRTCTNFFNYSRPSCDCKEVCECDNGYVRDSNGLCVTPESCPNLCGKKEKYACGSACDTECATLGQPCTIINIKCNEKCYCIDGYARNSKNECIPINKCPKY